MVPLLVSVLAFGCVAIIVFVVGRHLTNKASIQRRLRVATSPSSSVDLSENFMPESFLASLVGKLDEKKFGIEGSVRTKLRRDLIRAGYFSDQAIRLYIIARLGVVLVLPTITYLLFEIFFAQSSFYLGLAIAGLSAIIAILGPDFYIARRQRHLQYKYRNQFPDLIDMLVVCVDAGLSLNGAFVRILPEVSKQNRSLGINLALLGAETRAGRSLADALGTLADRLNIDEARAFVILLRQSLELGTDTGDALRVFGDEMRTKRLLRAEEMANKLPVKMVLPLGALIFPVILMVVLLPVIIRLISISRAVG
jgi:tight adherence protein C